jgi:hypothetical protein
MMQPYVTQKNSKHKHVWYYYPVAFVLDKLFEMVYDEDESILVNVEEISCPQISLAIQDLRRGVLIGRVTTKDGSRIAWVVFLIMIPLTW